MTFQLNAHELFALILLVAGIIAQFPKMPPKGPKIPPKGPKKKR
jgi:hypothetical protein